ncbi:MAG: hypothetical protein WBY44_26430 [Bryobacteraceae bacterium]
MTSAVRIDNKLKAAALQQDIESVAVLTIEAGSAFAARDQAREVFRQHYIAVHGAASGT